MRTMDDSLVEMGLKSHPAGSKTLDVAAIEDPALLRTVEGRMANLNKITGREPGKNPAVLDVEDDDPTLDDDTDVEDDDKDDDGQAASDDDDGNSTPEKEEKDEDKEKDKDAVEIPEAYVRAAIHSGWATEDIEEFVKVSPTVAAKTFENLYNSTNKASREWAAIGRASRKEADKTQESNRPDKLEYGGVDIAALKKEFDIDPAVEKMLEGSNASNKKLVDALNQLTEGKAVTQDTSRADRSVKYYDVATEAAEEQQVNNFFATDGMKLYSKFYGEIGIGETWEDLPRTQAKNRFAVYQTADQLLAGATMQSQPMGLAEALERAHLLVTEPMREEVIRSGIKKTVTKRRNSMVFRPSEGKGKKNDGGKPKTKGDLENKVAGLIQKALKA